MPKLRKIYCLTIIGKAVVSRKICKFAYTHDNVPLPIHTYVYLTSFLCHYPFFRFFRLYFVITLLPSITLVRSIFMFRGTLGDRSLRAVRNNQKERKTKNRSYRHRATKYDLLPFAETFLSPRTERKFHIFLFHQFSISSTRVANSLHSFVSRQ